MAKSWPVKVAFMKCASACSTALPLVILLAALSRGFALDLNKAVVVYPPKLSTPERKAITMLVEEVEKRTQIRWTAQSNWPNSAGAAIALGRLLSDNAWPEPYRKQIRRNPNPKAAEA